MDKIVAIDFAGTLIKAEMIEEANVFRSDVLKKAAPTRDQHGNPEEFYKLNRNFIEKLTDLKANAKIKYRKNDLGFMELTGEQVQNQIATNLFQIGMFMVAKKYKENIIPEGLILQLKRIKSKGYKLAIISGVRTDIISGMLSIARIPLEFDYIFGQPPILGMENQEKDIEQLQKEGIIEFSIGDKLSDLERIPDAVAIFVKWGHPSGGEEEFAEHTISKPEELEKLIST